MIKTKRATARPEIVRNISKIIRLSREELDALNQLAERYAGGNFSAFIREAALSYRKK